MPRPVIGSERRTHPLIWCAAIICTFFALIVIISGIVVFVGYLAIRPSVPYVSVTSAHLDKFYFSQGGDLNTQLTIVFKAENDNLKAEASFSKWSYDLFFAGIKVDTLSIRPSDLPFEVARNSSVTFTYVVEAADIPLDPHQMAVVDSSMKENKIAFELEGYAKTRWKVGPLGSLKFRCNLNCLLQFQGDGTSTSESHCTSKS